MKRKILMVAVLAASLGVLPAHADIQSSPIGAVSACGDGMFSTSGGKGTCSGHGGRLRLLTADESSGKVPFGGAQKAEPTSYTAVDSSVTVLDSQDNSQIMPDTMPTTGGAPFLMLAAGASLSLAAWSVRRRLDNRA